MRPLIFLGSSASIDSFVEVARLTDRPIAGIVDDNFFGNTHEICRIPVIGSEQSWEFEKTCNQFDYFIGSSMVPINVIDRKKRLKMIGIVKQYNLNLDTLIHPSSYIYPEVTIGAGSYVGYCASINNRVAIGKHCQIHAYVGISHDCEIGSNTCIAHQAMIAGQNQIGNNVHIGMGAAVCKNNVVVGNDAVIHPKITVMRDIEENEIVHLGGTNTRRIYGEVIRS